MRHHRGFRKGALRHHVKVGVVPGDGGAVISPLPIGPHRTKEFLTRVSFMTGEKAGRIRIVKYAVAPDQVLTRPTN
jgi:enoyl-CoA hydratase